MAINRDHYAIVVGLTLYPELDPPANLRGPENDAKAVEVWLVDPDGGGLLPENVTVITSPAPPPPGKPESHEIQQAFADLAKQAEAKRTALGALLGRRLYVYVAGHGFSPLVNQGCLLAANAGGFTRGANVYITKWLEQFQDAGYFFETVLWMDCCMNRDPRDQPSNTTVPERVSASPPGPSFAALAARRPLRAIEQPDSDGQYHGLFTTVLLEGLRGAAANAYGMVTGRSLADWLRNAQRARMSPEDLADSRVSKEPEILKEDQALIFARGVKPTEFEIELSIPGAEGKKCKLWRGRPLVSEAHAVDGSGTLKLSLPPGLYLVEVEATKLREGFEVTGPAKIIIKEKGEKVDPGPDLVPIRIDPADPTAEIYLIDQAFTLVDQAIGRLETLVPPAIYKTRVRSGDRLAEHVYLLDREPEAAPLGPELPAFGSAVPIYGAPFSHEYHVSGLNDAISNVGVQVGNSAQILLMSRVWRKNDQPPTLLPPSAALELWDETQKIADLLGQGLKHLDEDPYAALLVELDPGTYFVRRGRPDEGVAEQAIVALPGWRTSFFFLVTPDENEPADTGPPRSAMLMHPIGAPFDAEIDRLILQAQNAIGKNRAVLTDELVHVLIDNPQSPLAGVLGGHLLILEQKKSPSTRIERLRGLAGRLQAEFGPVRSGDVDALRLSSAPADQLGEIAISAPPMLRASWDIVCEGSLAAPGLVPAALFDRVFASVSAQPFLAWNADRASRSAYREAIEANLKGEEAAYPEELAPAAGPLPPDFSRGFAGGPPIGAVEDMGFGAAPPAPAPRPAKQISQETAAKLKSLGLPASALDL